MSYEDTEYVDICDLTGKTVTEVFKGDNHITFRTECGYSYSMYHEQDCCENVYIESIVGDLDDLIGVRMNLAEETSGEIPPDGDSYDSGSWTFYKFGTIKGYVDIRWNGYSNGYYSESVSISKQRIVNIGG